MDSSLQALPPVSGGNSEEERIFSVKLTKQGSSAKLCQALPS